MHRDALSPPCACCGREHLKLRRAFRDAEIRVVVGAVGKPPERRAARPAIFQFIINRGPPLALVPEGSLLRTLNSPRKKGLRSVSWECRSTCGGAQRSCRCSIPPTLRGIRVRRGEVDPRRRLDVPERVSAVAAVAECGLLAFEPAHTIWFLSIDFTNAAMVSIHRRSVTPAVFSLEWRSRNAARS